MMSRERHIVRDLLESFRASPESAPRARQDEAGGARSDLGDAIRTPSGAAICVGALIVAIAVNPLAGVCVPLLSLGVMFWLRSRRARHTRALLERDLPSLLTSIASSVRAGIDPMKALADSADQFPEESPLRSELSELRVGLTKGKDEVDLIDLFCSGFQHPDVELFKRCLILSRTHGSSLAEPLHRVTRVVRQRQSFRRKTKAALAMHRMSAVGIAGCAVLIGLMQVSVNRKGIQIAIANPVGVLFLVGGASLVAAGVAWMLSMGREEKL